KNNALELAEIFCDRGISGTKIDRAGLTDLLSAMNGIRKIIVLNTSRLWRDDISKVFIRRAFIQAKADIVSIEQPNYSLYKNDPSEIFFNGVLELLDQYERLNINLKLAKGRKTKARTGNKACGVAPLGYRWTHDAKIEIDPDGADLVKLIYDQYLNLGSLSKVKDDLDDSGYLTQRGNSFSKQALSDILSNEFYRGIVTHGTVKEKGQHPPIISAILFNRVQSKLTGNNKKNYY
ncbi:MAG: recombinase family protein, partial [Oscillospiraceae bacterium]|nr:recombinase family protein [Oscillospiraceae bacterium]